MMITGDANRSVRAEGLDRVENFLAMRNQPARTRLADKLLFCVGVAYVPASEWVMIVLPHRFPYWYTGSILLALSWRAFVFTTKKWHYFLLDFCYYINALCLLYLTLTHACPWPALFRVIFALSNGPLLVAIAVWRNSFVFHSVDKVTTTLVHALPPCLTYCVRWYPVETDGTPFAAHRARDAFGTIEWWDIGVNSMVAYVIWQALYFLITEVMYKRQLEADDELLTSLKWLSRDRQGSMYRLCHWVNVRLRLMASEDHFHEREWRTKVTFWSAQLVYTIVTLPLVRLMFDWHALHLGVLLGFLSATVWNGANFYFEVFSRRYNLQFAQQPAAGLDAVAHPTAFDDQQPPPASTVEPARGSAGPMLTSKDRGAGTSSSSVGVAAMTRLDELLAEANALTRGSGAAAPRRAARSPGRRAS